MFTINHKEQEAFARWLQEHDKTCPYYDDGTSPRSPQGAIGGRITFSFTPTSIGICVHMTCACGGKVDVTDFKDW